MPKRGGKRKKTRTHTSGAPEGATILKEEDFKQTVPRSIVARSGNVVAPLKELVRDLRKLMAPYTATNLKEKSYNKLKDYTNVAGALGVSHILNITQTHNNNVILKVAKNSAGPTLHFKVINYSLCRHIKAMQKRPYDSTKAFSTPPLVVLNNFGNNDANHVKVMRAMFQNVLPSIDVKTVQLSECRRVSLFHYKKDSDVVEWRHYAVRAAPVGLNRGVKKILQGKIPNLGKLEDVSEFMDGAGLGAVSDSEAEDESSHVILADRFVGKGNSRMQQSAMKLVELGPRLTLEIFKVENGFGEGDVLFHKYLHKSKAEADAIKTKFDSKLRLKTERRQEQEENVKRKRENEEEKRREKSERKRAKYQSSEGGENEGAAGSDSDSEEEDEEEESEEYEADEGSSNDDADSDDFEEEGDDDESV